MNKIRKTIGKAKTIETYGWDCGKVVTLMNFFSVMIMFVLMLKFRAIHVYTHNTVL